MPIVDILSPAGTKAGSVDLPDDVFDVQTNIPLIHQVVVGQLAAARRGTASTKTRGEVRGGGRKPHKQKGTGRARQGSTRAPQFVGGGVVHGPKPRGYSPRGSLHLPGRPLRVVTRLRSMNDATADELGCPGRSLTGAAGALLLVRLATTTAHLGARLGGVRALTSSGELADDDLMNQGDVGLHVEDVVREVNRAGLRAGGAEDVNGGHGQAPLAAVRTKTMPPRGPGTAPLISSKPLSASTAWIVRF